MMTGKLADIYDGIEEYWFCLFGHIGRRSTETPVQPVGVTADRDGMEALGTLASRDNLCIWGIEVSPWTSNHTYFIAFAIAIIFILNLPHGYCSWHFFVGKFAIFFSSCWCRTILGGNPDRIRTLEDGTLGIHIIGMTKKTEAIPVVLHTDASTYGLTLFGNRDDRTVEVFGKILSIYHFAVFAILAHRAAWFQWFEISIDDSYVIIV